MMLAEGVVRLCEARPMPALLTRPSPRCSLSTLVSFVAHACLPTALPRGYANQDLSVDPSDVVLIVLSYHFKASEICQFSKEEFVGGMQRLGCESIAKLKDRLPSLRQSLSDDGERSFATGGRPRAFLQPSA